MEFGADLVLESEELDAQHREVFRRLEDAAAVLDRGTAEVDAALGAFVDALMAHVTAEEALMERALYPDRARHRIAHEVFVADLLQLRAELREKGPTPLVSEWLARRIPEWLRFHVRVNDAPLATYLARRPPPTGAARPRNAAGRRPS
jgi:hemerythrin